MLPKWQPAIMTCFRLYKQISQLPNQTAPNDGWQPRLTASIVYFYPFFWIIPLCNSFLEKKGGTRNILCHCRMTAPHPTFINTPLQMTLMFMSNLFSFIQLYLGRLEISSKIRGRNSEWTELKWKKEQEKRYCCVSSSGHYWIHHSKTQTLSVRLKVPLWLISPHITHC